MKQVKNEMRLDFPSCSANESFARIAVAAFAAQLDPTVDEIADLKTAVSEAVTNCIVHGYADRIGRVYIHAKLLEDDVIWIKVRDTGCGIADVQQAMQPMFTTCTTGERAGLGFAVMQSFMDSVRVHSRVGKGTSVVLKKKMTSRGAANA